MNSSSDVSQSDYRATVNDIDRTTELTGAGRKIEEGGMTRVIDEAHWNQPLQQSTSGEFALVSSKGNDKSHLSIESPFLVSLFENIIKKIGIMGTTKGSNSISFPEPCVPLYWCYSEIIQSGSDTDCLKQQDTKDLQSLRYWYEKWALPGHIQLRETIRSGFITFDDLWALYRPGETLCGRDKFEQSELSIVVDVQYRSVQMPPSPFREARTPHLPSANRFEMEIWFQDWDLSRRVFVQSSAFKYVTNFAGSRHISSLELYPLRLFGGGDETKIQTLQRNLEQRGRRWEELVGPSAQHLYHEGPATALRVQTNGFELSNGPKTRNNKHVWANIMC